MQLYHTYHHNWHNSHHYHHHHHVHHNHHHHHHHDHHHHTQGLVCWMIDMLQKIVPKWGWSCVKSVDLLIVLVRDDDTIGVVECRWVIYCDCWCDTDYDENDCYDDDLFVWWWWWWLIVMMMGMSMIMM